MYGLISQLAPRLVAGSPPLTGLLQEIGKPKVVPWKKDEKDDLGYYVGSDTGQAPGNDPVMLVAVVGAILALSYVFLG